MTLTWCNPKTRFLDINFFSKSTKLEKKSSKKFLTDLVLKLLILFVNKKVFFNSISNWCLKKILLVNSISSQMFRVWYNHFVRESWHFKIVFSSSVIYLFQEYLVSRYFSSKTNKTTAVADFKLIKASNFPSKYFALYSLIL